MINLKTTQFWRKLVSGLMAVAFLLQSTSIAGSAPNFSAGGGILPAPGSMVSLSQAAQPPVLKGVKVYADEPFRFDFILDKGTGHQALGTGTDPECQVPSAKCPGLKDESSKLIRYFLASLTVPEKDLWVNLSPYEKDRIITNEFGQTEMGRDLLAQDYLLKQLTASVIYPEGETGKKFWAEVYQKAFEKYGTTDIPVDTFNKVWIVPEKAVVYEKTADSRQRTAVEGTTTQGAQSSVAYVVEARLKVMLESDYLASGKSGACASAAGCQLPATPVNESQELGKQVLRDVVIPVLEKEVNEGANFAQLRQVYYSLILAAWYKRKVKESLLSAVYVDQKKTKGIDVQGQTSDVRRQTLDPEVIWSQYVQAFKKGAYNYIKEEQDKYTGETIPRKYFSGGMNFDPAQALSIVHDFATPPSVGNDVIVRTAITSSDRAMAVKRPAVVSVGQLAGKIRESVASNNAIDQIQCWSARVSKDSWNTFDHYYLISPDTDLERVILPSLIRRAQSEAKGTVFELSSDKGVLTVRAIPLQALDTSKESGGSAADQAMRTDGGEDLRELLKRNPDALKGMSQVQIAKLVGLSQPGAKWSLDQAGLKTPGVLSRERSDAFAAWVLGWMKEYRGEELPWTERELAKAFAISQSTIHRKIQESKDALGELADQAMSVRKGGAVGQPAPLRNGYDRKINGFDRKILPYFEGMPYWVKRSTRSAFSSYGHSFIDRHHLEGMEWDMPDRISIEKNRQAAYAALDKLTGSGWEQKSAEGLLVGFARSSGSASASTFAELEGFVDAARLAGFSLEQMDGILRQSSVMQRNFPKEVLEYAAGLVRELSSRKASAQQIHTFLALIWSTVAPGGVEKNISTLLYLMKQFPGASPEEIFDSVGPLFQKWKWYTYEILYRPERMSGTRGMRLSLALRHAEAEMVAQMQATPEQLKPVDTSFDERLDGTITFFAEHGFQRPIHALAAIVKSVLDTAPRNGQTATRETLEAALGLAEDILRAVSGEKKFEDLPKPALEDSYIKAVDERMGSLIDQERRYQNDPLFYGRIGNRLFPQDYLDLVKGLRQDPSRFAQWLSKQPQVPASHPPVRLKKYKQLSSPEQRLTDLLRDPDRLRLFLKAVTLLRMAFPYDGDFNNSKTPLEYAKEKGLIFTFMDGVRISPATQSFRRHLIGVTGEDGTETWFEVKIPGRDEGRDQIFEKTMEVARDYRNAYRGHQADVAEPVALLKTMGNFEEFYGFQTRFTSVNPLGIAVFGYEDGQRLVHLETMVRPDGVFSTGNQLISAGYHSRFVETMIRSSMLEGLRARMRDSSLEDRLHLMAEYIGLQESGRFDWAPTEEYKAFLQDIAVQTMRIGLRFLELGYRGYNEHATDWHLENFRLLLSRKVQAVGDFNVFEKNPVPREEWKAEVKKLFGDSEVFLHGDFDKLYEQALAVHDQEMATARQQAATASPPGGEVVDRAMTVESPNYYRNAKEMWLSRLGGQRMPNGFWHDQEMAVHSIWVALDTIDGFPKARRENNIKEMARLYREGVIPYRSRRGRQNGQVAFFLEVGKLGGLFDLDAPFLAKTGSPAAFLRLALPGLINLTDPEALDPLEVEINYWTEPENARYHIFQALDTIPGFKELREHFLAGEKEINGQSVIKQLAELYRLHVINYQSTKTSKRGQQVFFHEVGGLLGLMNKDRPFFSKKDSPASVLRFALPGLIDLNDPNALDPLEVEANYWTDPANAKIHTFQALDTIPGFKVLREAHLRGEKQLGDVNIIKRMAELYRENVIGYHSPKEEGLNGQIGFFYEIGKLGGLMGYARPFLAKTNSPASLMRFALPGLIDADNPDALAPLEVESDYWTNPENAKRHAYQALDTISGFRELREAYLRGERELGGESVVKKMAELYRTYVIGYQSAEKARGGQYQFFYDRGGIGGLLTNERPYLAKFGPASLLRLALPGLIDLLNPDALDPLEVEKGYWTDPENAKFHTYRALDTIPGFQALREAYLRGEQEWQGVNVIRGMAGLYRTHVIGYRSPQAGGRNGQVGFFYEFAKLTGLLIPERPYLAKRGSPASLIRFVLPGLIDDDNPDALQSLEVGRGADAAMSDEEIEALEAAETAMIKEAARRKRADEKGVGLAAVNEAKDKGVKVLRTVDFEESIRKSNVPRDKFEGAAGVMTIYDFMERYKELAPKGRVGLGLDSDDLVAISQAAGLDYWRSAYLEVFGRLEPRPVELIDWVTAQGKAVFFFVPNNVLSYEGETADELRAIMEDPKTKAKVFFVFGLYDALSRDGFKDAFKNFSRDESLTVMARVFENHKNFLKDLDAAQESEIIERINTAYRLSPGESSDEIDLTGLLGPSRLSRGSMSRKFPLLEGKLWQFDTMRVGKNLTRAAVRISHLNDGSWQWTITGYRGETETGKSFWRWKDGNVELVTKVVNGVAQPLVAPDTETTEAEAALPEAGPVDRITETPREEAVREPVRTLMAGRSYEITMRYNESALFRLKRTGREFQIRRDKVGAFSLYLLVNGQAIGQSVAMNGDVVFATAQDEESRGLILGKHSKEAVTLFTAQATGNQVLLQAFGDEIETPGTPVSDEAQASIDRAEAQAHETVNINRMSPEEAYQYVKNAVDGFLSRFGLAYERYDQTSTPFSDEPGIEARFIAMSPLEPARFYFASSGYSLNVLLATVADRKSDTYFGRVLEVTLGIRTNGKVVITLERPAYLPADHFLWKLLPRIRALLKRISAETGFPVIDQVFEKPKYDKFTVKDILNKTFDEARKETGFFSKYQNFPYNMSQDLFGLSWADIKTYSDFRQQVTAQLGEPQPGTLMRRIAFIQAWSRKLASAGIIPESALPSKEDLKEDARRVHEERRARAKGRLENFTKKRNEERRKVEAQRQQAEISGILDEVNATEGKEVFNTTVKAQIAAKVATWQLEPGKSVLVVGHAGRDYLPVVLAKMGLKVSAIDTDEDVVAGQNALHRRFGLDQSIDSFSSYEDLRDRKFDYITALAVINMAVDITDEGTSEQLFLAKMLVSVMPDDKGLGDQVDAIARHFYIPQVRDFMAPLIKHLNPNGGRLLINKPGKLGFDTLAKSGDNFSDVLWYLDKVMPALGKEFGIRFVAQPEIDVSNVTLHPGWFNELNRRAGLAYRAEPDRAMGEASWDQWKSIKTVELAAQKDGQVQILQDLSLLKWTEMKTEDLEKLKAFVINAQKEFPEYLTDQMVQDALKDPDGVLELIRRSHPYTLEVLGDPDRFTHQFRLHEGMYYWLFARKLLGRTPPGPVVVMNVDPHRDHVTDKDMVDYSNGSHGVFTVKGVNDTNWTVAAIRDGLADTVVVAVRPLIEEKWFFSVFRKNSSGQVVDDVLIDTPNNFQLLGQKLAEMFSGHHLFLTVDLDSFSGLKAEAKRRGVNAIHLDQPEIRKRLSTVIQGLKVIGAVPEALITADSRGYLDPEAKAVEDWISQTRATVRTAVEEAFAGVDKAREAQTNSTLKSVGDRAMGDEVAKEIPVLNIQGEGLVQVYERMKQEGQMADTDDPRNWPVVENSPEPELKTEFERKTNKDLMSVLVDLAYKGVLYVEDYKSLSSGTLESFVNSLTTGRWASSLMQHHFTTPLSRIDALFAAQKSGQVIKQDEIIDTFRYKCVIREIMRRSDSTLDKAEAVKPGGIDLNAVEKDLRVRSEGQAMKFNIDPAMLQEYQTAPGFVPVILNIEPLESLPAFLGARGEDVEAGVG